MENYTVNTHHYTVMPVIQLQYMYELFITKGDYPGTVSDTTSCSSVDYENENKNTPKPASRKQQKDH